MIFSAVLSLGLVSFFLGGAFGCLFCIIIAKILKKKYQKCRFSLIFVFLSFSIIFFTIFVIFVQKKYSLGLISKNRDDLQFLIILFALGTIVFAFWKYILFPFLAVYILFSIHFFNFFSSRFYNSPRNLSLNIQSENDSVSIKVYKIPPKFLFFVDRFYYDVSFDDFSKNGNSISENLSLHKDDCNFIQKQLEKFDRWLLKDFEIQQLKIPKSYVYPSLYVLKFTAKFDNFIIDINRTL